MEDLAKRTTLEVVTHHNKYLNAGDLEQTVADYNEDSFIMTPGGPVKGLEAIRAFFKANIESHLPPETKMTYHKVVAEGELGYTQWEAESPYVTYLMGSDTFIVKNGKIVMQSFAGYTK